MPPKPKPEPEPKSKPPALYWLRRDLRVRDNPALVAAMRAGPVIAVYILEDDRAAPPPRSALPGSAARWWLHHSLTALERELAKLGIPLLLRRGEPLAVLKAVARDNGAASLHYSRMYDRQSRARDAAVESALSHDGFAVSSYNSLLLHEPWELATKAGTPFRVYTPFSRALFAALPTPPVPAPKAQPAIDIGLRLDSDRLADWHLLPTQPDWAGGFRRAWQVGEAAAHRRLLKFTRDIIRHYGEGRNLPSNDYSSSLSPYLAFGELSPRQVWQAVSRTGVMDASRTTYLKEIAWRDFAYHVLYHAPELPDRPLDAKFGKFPYRRSQPDLQRWRHGRTGYPIVDAGMRQLWQTGWMHNRVRLIVASFLIKHLLLPWQEGADWFFDTLVDADIASNSMNWQWVAGCGPDAAPYFRIFNPVLQSRKFKAAAYIRSFVPELASLPDRYIHAPWEAPPCVREAAGVSLGSNGHSTYPAPMVDHDAARARALFAFKEMRAKTAVTAAGPALAKPTAAAPARRSA